MQMLTPKEVAARLSVSSRTVYSWISEGRLDAVHLSERVTRVPEESLEAFLAAATLRESGSLAAEERSAYGGTATLSALAPASDPEPGSESQRLWELLRAHRDEIVRVVESCGGMDVRVFGSVVHGDATVHSDIDLLIDARPGMSLFDLSDIQSRIEGIVGRKVDVVVDRSLHPEIRRVVLAEARAL